jgi:uncharacterized protein
MKKKPFTKTSWTVIGAAAVAAACAAIVSSSTPARANEAAVAQQRRKSMQLTEEWDKTFPKSDLVEHQKVTFKNRYGITLAADLYVPKTHAGTRLPALAVSGPFGAVKEQASGLYAQTMAERGFVTLAFDPSYTGESGGEPRNVPSPEINTEDFSAAVDYLGLHAGVDRERIGIIGICGFGGMGLSATAVDKRVKAVVTTSMYDMSRVMSKGYYDSRTPAERTALLEQLGQRRWADAASGSPAAGPRILPETLPDSADAVTRMYFDYYRTPRGFHERSPNSNGSFTATAPIAFNNLPLLTYIAEIAPRPILLIAGDKAHSRYFSEDAFKAAAEPKELLIVKDADHAALYDRTDKIPFDRIAEFFTKNLK